MTITIDINKDFSTEYFPLHSLCFDIEEENGRIVARRALIPVVYSWLSFYSHLGKSIKLVFDDLWRCLLLLQVSSKCYVGAVLIFDQGRVWHLLLLLVWCLIEIGYEFGDDCRVIELDYFWAIILNGPMRLSSLILQWASFSLQDC